MLTRPSSLSPHPLNSYEVLNSFLMQQPMDLYAAPLSRRVLLSCAFAACLWMHLSYFFWSVCAAFVLLRGDRVEGWVPPFDRPFAATDPVGAAFGDEAVAVLI